MCCRCMERTSVNWWAGKSDSLLCWKMSIYWRHHNRKRSHSKRGTHRLHNYHEWENVVKQQQKKTNAREERKAWTEANTLLQHKKEMAGDFWHCSALCRAVSGTAKIWQTGFSEWHMNVPAQQPYWATDLNYMKEIKGRKAQKEKRIPLEGEVCWSNPISFQKKIKIVTAIISCDDKTKCQGKDQLRRKARGYAICLLRVISE